MCEACPPLTVSKRRPVRWATVAEAVAKALGEVRSMNKSMGAAVQEYVDPSSTLVRDEYLIVDGDAHVNTTEGFPSLLTREINRTHRHVARQHLGQYRGEFDFRCNTRDLSCGQRTAASIRKVGGQRLMPHRPSGTV